MPSPGSRVAHYVIEGHLGQGGMGEVWLAFDERLERRVALKFLPVERLLDAVARGRMLREARAASALNHPGIVTIYEVGDANGLTYIAMELVEGETLARLSGRRGPMPPAEAVALIRQIGDALAVAHDAGILHRDVKTANLMIDARGRVKVLDFGLSKRVPGSGAPSTPPMSLQAVSDAMPPTESDHGERQDVDPAGPTILPESKPSPYVAARMTPPSSDPVTIHGARMGTPGRAALELMRGEEADRRSDVFSLGVVLYELLAGRTPFRSENMNELIDQLSSESYKPASHFNPDVNPRLDAVIARALKAQREDRFDTVGEMMAAADAAIAPTSRTAKTPRRALMVAGVAIALGGGLAIWAEAGRPSNRRDAPVASVPDAAPPGPLQPGRPAGPPRQLTQLGGCAYAPTFADDHTIAFDETIGGENHLWRVPLAGGKPQQLTRGTLTEWRAMPGRHPGEVVYLVTNPNSNTGEGAGVAALDLAGEKKPEMLSPQQSTSAMVIDGTVYYIRRDATELRRLKNGVDESALEFPKDVTAKMLAVAGDGRHVALLAANPGTPRVCIGDLVDKTVTCLKSRRMGTGRPDYSTDDKSIYYAGFQGIGRVSADGISDDIVMPDIYAQGGIVVSPDGQRLVYSDCYARGPLIETGETPPRELAPAGRIGDVGAGPDGFVAFSQSTADGFALMLREPGGQIREIVAPSDHRIVQPRFSRDGKHIVYMLAGVGLYVATITPGHTLPPIPVTTDPSDGDPAWLPDGRLAFTRHSGETAGAHIMEGSGGVPVRVGTSPRRTVGALADGRLLLLAFDAAEFFEWDPKRHRETKSPVSGTAVGRVVGIAISPGGQWLAVQAGEQAERVYRYDLNQANPEPELVFEAAKGDTLGGISITDAGRVIAAPMAWAGEIYSIDAAPGTRF